MLFFVTGAGGAGKSSLIPYLREQLLEMHVEDFDVYPDREAIGPLDTTEQRQRVAEAWIRQALANAPRHTVICGLGVMGEVFACPSAPLLDHITFCLLDCDDMTRLDRIRQRGDVHNASMEMLCWSAYLRVHHADPQFRQDVIKTGKLPSMVWSRWTNWQRGHPHWRHVRIDTTTRSIPEVAVLVTAWVHAEQQRYADGYRLMLDAATE